MNVLTSRGGLFCAVNVFQQGLPLDLIARAKKLWPPHGGSRRAHTRKRETHPSLPSPDPQHCKPIFSPGRTPSCALRRMARSTDTHRRRCISPTGTQRTLLLEGLAPQPHSGGEGAFTRTRETHPSLPSHSSRRARRAAPAHSPAAPVYTYIHVYIRVYIYV